MCVSSACRIFASAGVVAKNCTLTVSCRKRAFVARAGVLARRDAAAVVLDRAAHEIGQLRVREVGRGVLEIEPAAVLLLHNLERPAKLRRLRGDAPVSLEPVGQVVDRDVVVAVERTIGPEQHREHERRPRARGARSRGCAGCGVRATGAAMARAGVMASLRRARGAGAGAGGGAARWRRRRAAVPAAAAQAPAAGGGWRAGGAPWPGGVGGRRRRRSTRVGDRSRGGGCCFSCAPRSKISPGPGWILVVGPRCAACVNICDSSKSCTSWPALAVSPRSMHVALRVLALGHAS